MSTRPSTLSLLQHLQKHAGNHIGTEAKPPSRSPGEYRLECFEDVDDDTITVASNGIRHVDDGTPFGEEIACTLRKSQARYARAIVGSTCEYIVERGQGLEFGQIIDAQGELVSGSGKEGLLASAHPFLAEEFNYLSTRPDLTLESVELQIITLIPMTRAEIDFAGQDMDALYDHWETIHPDLHDIARPCTI